MEEKIIISIIIPCYNDVEYIEQSVLSALSQTYPFTEVIVVDDGSNEETKVILKKLECKITKLITQGNKGQSTARNVGIQESKGNYILVLDSDDYFEPTFCEKAIGVFLENENVKIVTCSMNRIIGNRIHDVFSPQGGFLKDFLINNCATGSAMYRKEDWRIVGGYDQNMNKGFEDWEFYIRLIKDGGRAYVIQETLFNYRMRENSTTAKANMIKYDLLKFIYKKHQTLYLNNFDLFVHHLLSKIEREEKEKIKNTQRLEFKIGHFILKPFRFMKTLFN
jgi:hypothetical protein